MKSLISLRQVPLLLLVLIMAGLPQPGAAFSWRTLLQREQTEQMVQIRLAGIQGDKTRIAEFTRLLPNPPGIKNPYYNPQSKGCPSSMHEHLAELHDEDVDNYFRLALMHALAQMGAVGAAPALDAIIQNNTDEEVVAYAKICKARLLAESGTLSQGSDTPKQLAAKITRFLSKMNLTAENINGGVTDYQARRAKFPNADGSAPSPLELLALREIADIVYHDSFQGSASLPILYKIDFSKDEPSALKMRLAPLSRTQRITSLIQDLTIRKPAQLRIDAYKEQLLSDEGIPAKAAIATQLKPTLAVAVPNSPAYAAVPGAVELTLVYNNIDTDGTVMPVLLTNNVIEKAVIHPRRQLFVTEY